LNTTVEISATIILYKEDVETLQKTIDSFLKTPLSKKLYLIDNSPTNKLQNHFLDPAIEYRFVGKNSGFGAAHNLVINEIQGSSKYHLILNPDVIFESEVLLKLKKELDNHKEIAMVSPKVIYPDGKLQYTCRKYPTFLELIYRRFGVFKKFTQKQEYRDEHLIKSFYPDFFQGCFLLFNTADFVAINGFDERYFLYMEDVDICKKIDKQGKRKMYFPGTEIVHNHRRGSSQKIILLFHHISSAIKYFKKWKN